MLIIITGREPSRQARSFRDMDSRDGLKRGRLFFASGTSRDPGPGLLGLKLCSLSMFVCYMYCELSWHLIGRQSLRPSHGRWRRPSIGDFKDMVYPLFESDPLFLECLFVLC